MINLNDALVTCASCGQRVLMTQATTRGVDLVCQGCSREPVTSGPKLEPRQRAEPNEMPDIILRDGCE